MNAISAFADTALETASHLATSAGGRLQEVALDIIAGPGGPLILVLGLAGVVVLALDAGGLAVRGVRGWLRRRSPAPSREARVRGLVSLGAAPAEIARAVGLPRDAISLVLPLPSSPRPKVPAAAHSAARTEAEPHPAPQQSRAQVVEETKVVAVAAPTPQRARPLPLQRPRNAHVPNFGEAA